MPASSSTALSLEQLSVNSLGLDLPNQLPNFIAIEGPIGVGKTTLANNLATTLSGTAFLERADENPFLERFYRDSKGYALPTQLSFLMQRCKQIEDLRQSDMFTNLVISDFLIDKDPIFAQTTLGEDEYRLYQMVNKQLNINPPKPDLVVYLQAEPSILLDRISKRGIAVERRIDNKYLDTLSEAYTQFFYYYSQSPLLIVNTAEIDFSSNKEHYRQLVQEIISDNKGKRYYSLQPD